MRQCKKAIPITQAKVTTDNEKTLVLEYSLRCINGSGGGELYGLRVDKRSPTGALLEREETPALTDSRVEAIALAEAFAAGTVPPCVLLEMVDEWHGVFIKDIFAHPLGCTG